MPNLRAATPAQLDPSSSSSPASRWLSLLPILALAATLAFPSTARAQSSAAATTRPSVFTYAGRGFLLGSLVGLSSGYLVARDGGWDDGDWQPLAYGVGIGALAGGALGLTLGIVDLSRNTPGFGAVILRDTVYGAAFGAAAGGIVGALTLISTKDGEHVLLGASVGSLVGAVVGVVLGIIEGDHTVATAGYASEQPPRPPAYTVTVATVAGPGGGAVWMPAFAGRY